MSFPAIRQVIVFQGLLNLDLNSDELSFILAHEIAHHLKLPEQILKNNAWRESGFAQQVEELRINCQAALKDLPPDRFKAGLAKCRETVAIWRQLDKGLYSQEVEQFVDEVALDVLRESGISTTAAITAMEKISAGEQIRRPGISQLLVTAWHDSFRTHPPAWKRLEYLKYRIDF